MLLVDEIDKGLKGATGEQGDGGVSSDALGTLLSWLQDRKGSVFVIATANDVRALPPEVLRKGRFDELFWMDLPSEGERAGILAAALASFDRAPMPLADLRTVAASCDGFTGSEIAAIVGDAMFSAFADGERPIEPMDLIVAAQQVKPLSSTAGEKIKAMRDWAKGRMRPTSSVETKAAGGTAGDLDL